jgi:hypothetical protein
MISDIIDILVDVSNTFGSLCSYFRLKYKRYDTIINNQPPLDLDKVEQLYEVFPRLKKEIMIYNQHPLYVMIDRYNIKKNRTSLLIVLLNEKYKYIHSFSILEKNGIFPDLVSPCYWKF